MKRLDWTELNDQTAKSLKCSSLLLHRWLLNDSCCAEREIILDSFILVNKPEDGLTFQ